LSKFCPYCHCLILDTGRCRNGDCVLGNHAAATSAQLEKVYKLCEELEIDTEGRDPNKLTKDAASKLMQKLIQRKVFREIYGGEEL
jgi:hypothetical protein